MMDDVAALRAEFERLLAEKTAPVEDSIAPLQAEMEAALEAALRVRYPGKPPRGHKGPLTWRDAPQLLGAEVFADLRAPFAQRAEEIYRATRLRKEQLDTELSALAERITPEPGSEWTLARTVDSSDFNSQGYGAGTYARAQAVEHAEHIERQGLTVEVRCVPWREKYLDDKFLRKSSIIEFQVWVKASALDIEIARRRPGLSLAEWLQWCWDRCVNPRVLIPGLPHGLEEKLGVRMQGKAGLAW